MSYSVDLCDKAREMLYSLCKHYEGLHDGDLKEIGLQPKMCPAGYWTEGYGQVVIGPNGKMLHGAANKELAYKYSKIHTVEQAVEALDKALFARQTALKRHFAVAGVMLNCFEQAALISFVYNIGMGNFLKSSLWRDIKAKANRNKIDVDFRMWNKGGGRVLPGLVKRRTCESYLYLMNELKIF